MTTLITLLTTVSAQFGLPHGLLDSVCFVESGRNPAAIHYHDGDGDSIGLCQIKLKTARWMGYRGTEKKLFTPEVNAKYAAKYLQYQIIRYRGSTTKAVIAYNRGNAKELTSTAYSIKVHKQWRRTNANDKKNINFANGL